MPDLTPDVTTTPNFDPGRVAIASGWLVYDVGYHTCGGYGPESGYAHEPGCGAFDEENTYTRPKSGNRDCRKCIADRIRKSKQRKRDPQ